MAQDIYYNDIVAQLVELRNQIGEGGGSGGSGGTIDTSKLEAKLDEVIKAVKEIKVSTDSISVEAGTINLSTDELEGLLKTVNTNLGIINENVNEFDTNIQTSFTGFIAQIIKAIKDNLDKVNGDEFVRHNEISGKLSNIIDELIDPFNGTGPGQGANINVLLGLIKEELTNIVSIISNKTTDTTNINNIAKLIGESIPSDGTEFTPTNTIIESLQALTESTTDKGIADITKELTDYLKNIVGLKDEEIGTLYTLINSVDNSLLSIDHEMTPVKNLISSGNSSLQQIKNSLGNTVAPADGSVNKLLTTLNELIASNADPKVDTVLNRLKAIMTNDTAIANAQMTVGENQHTELLDAINNGTLSTYLQDVIGPREVDTSTLYELIDNIDTNVQKINTTVLADRNLSASRNSILTLMKNALGTTTPNENSILVQLSNLINIFNNSTVIPGKKTITEFLESVLISGGGNTVGEIAAFTRAAIENIYKIVGDIRVNTGLPTDDSNPDGSIHAKLRSLLMLIGPGDIQYIGGGQNPNSIIGSMAIVLNELGALMKKHHEEIKEAIQFQNSILNDNFNPPLHDYTIRIVSNLKLDPTTEFRLTNTATTSNSPQNIYKDYISLPINKTLYLNYTDFASTYHAYFYVDGQNTKIPGNIKILNEDKKDVTNGGGSYQQGIAPKGSGDTLQTKSIYIILT